jgi:hypothetical protein
MSELQRMIDQAAVAKQCTLDEAAIGRLKEQVKRLDDLVDVLPEARTRRDELVRQIGTIERRICDSRAAAVAEAEFFDRREKKLPGELAAYTARVQSVVDQLAALTPVVIELAQDGKVIADTYGRWNGDRQEGVPEVVALVCDPSEGLTAGFTERRSLIVRWLDRIASRDKAFHGLEVVPPQKQAA